MPDGLRGREADAAVDEAHIYQHFPPGRAGRIQVFTGSGRSHQAQPRTANDTLETMQVPQTNVLELPEGTDPSSDGIAADSLIKGYNVVRVVGRGAMASVYLAVQRSLQRRVALKVMNVDYSAELEQSLRFLHEGRLLASLNHRAIITIYDIGVCDGLHYLSMEYLEGGDLRRRMQSPVRPGYALLWLEGIASGLAAAHAKGIVHRDVKPANILFRADDSPVVTDFGVAKDLNQDSAMTVDGAVVGTLSYLSPEQAEGMDLDGRSDIYSLGVLFYEMLTAQRPWRLGETSQSQAGLLAILKQKRERLPRLPTSFGSLQGLLDRMTAVKVSDRYTAEAVVEAIQRLRKTIAQSRRAGGAAPSGKALDASGSNAPIVESESLLGRVYADYSEGRLRIPTVPEVIIRIRKTLDNPSVRVADVARLLQSEPSVAAQVVRVANSALYAAGRPVDGPQAAIARLGLDATRDIVSAFAARNAFKAKTPLIAERMRKVWQNACIVAAVCAVLSRHVAGFNPDQALLAGLLHSIGRLAVLGCADQYPETITCREDIDHCEERLQAQIGATVLRKWNFPACFVMVALECERWERDSGPTADLCDLVLVAKLFSVRSRPEGQGLPDAEAVPAFQRLAASARRGSAFTLEVLREAQLELDELMRCLHG
jgi:serine/threonine protein kinase